MTRLGELVDALAPAQGARVDGEGWRELAVHDVVCDSRRVGAGCLFVAVAGHERDGAAYAAAAVRAGAMAVVAAAEAAAGLASLGVPVVAVAAPRRALGQLAAAHHRHPSERIAVLAVTGTNGKTTTAVLTAQLLVAAGRRAAALGTLGLWTPEGLERGGLTTPDAADLQRRLAALADAGYDAVVIEASSHALDQDRLEGVVLCGAAYTNLGRDHLDYHGSVERYAAAKALLFDHAGVGADNAFVNADDAHSAPLIAVGKATGFSFRGAPAARLQVAGLAVGPAGIALRLCRDADAPIALRAPLLGAHNAQNLVAAALLAGAVGVDGAQLAAAAPRLVAPPGRLQPVGNRLGALALVDYAHTPDALAAALDVCRGLAGPAGRVIVVFGCGGDRDRGKRPEMGAVAAARADVVVVTSDNPRSEDPGAIVAATAAGALDAGGRAAAKLVPSTLAAAAEAGAPLVVSEVDRGRAIGRAVGVLGRGDVLLVAGKGHELTQTIGDEVLPFDDADVLARWLGQRRVDAADAAAALDTAASADDALKRWRRAEDWRGAALADVCSGALVGSAERVAAGVGSDSRAIAPDSVFVALRGERFDGHAFVAQAIADGAAGVVVARGEAADHRAALAAAGAFAVEVDDTLVALGDLGRHHRRCVDRARLAAGRAALEVVGVTGSNGKTSTKELLALALSPFGETLATLANHNNRIGVPQTLQRLRPEHDRAVVEMGMSVPGEIAALAAAAEPAIGVVTNVAEAHLEGLGSLAAIAHEKAALLRALPAGGVAVAPAAGGPIDAELGAVRARLLRFGGADSDARALTAPVWRDGHQHFVAEVLGARVEVALPALGAHMVDNALAALLVAALVGDNLVAAARALRRYRPVGQRMRPLVLAGRLVLEDCYNANPASVRSALRTLVSQPSPHVAVLGEMRELGPSAEALHREVAAACAGVARLVAVGAHATAMVAAASAVGVDAVAVGLDDIDAAAAAAAAAAPSGATILVKASRGARLERVVDALRQRWPAEEAA